MPCNDNVYIPKKLITGMKVGESDPIIAQIPTPTRQTPAYEPVSTDPVIAQVAANNLMATHQAAWNDGAAKGFFVGAGGAAFITWLIMRKGG